MKIYEVGGCVRDKFMGLTPKDFDYVVVGATEQQLLDLGMKKVGADFPVFLFEECEYALARTERKTGVGYKGFETRFSPDVTLEEDLFRRDFTMNAIAWNFDGYIDPYNGIEDIKNKVIRHVNKDAFVEDPVRILRAFRFSVRYGFDIHESTIKLMKSFSDAELRSLTRERVYLEFEKALKDQKGYEFIYMIRKTLGIKTLLSFFEGIDPHITNLWSIDMLYKEFGMSGVMWRLGELNLSDRDVQNFVEYHVLSRDDFRMIELIRYCRRVKTVLEQKRLIHETDYFRRPYILKNLLKYIDMTKIDLLKFADKMSEVKAKDFPDCQGIQIKHAIDSKRTEIFYQTLRGESSCIQKP